jgi:hypothetical protein
MHQITHNNFEHLDTEIGGAKRVQGTYWAKVSFEKEKISCCSACRNVLQRVKKGSNGCGALSTTAPRGIRQAGTILLPPEQGGMTVREERKGAGRPSADKEIIGLGNLTQFQEVLKESGISDNTAFIWQKVARVPEDKFEV